MRRRSTASKSRRRMARAAAWESASWVRSTTRRQMADSPGGLIVAVDMACPRYFLPSAFWASAATSAQSFFQVARSSLSCLGPSGRRNPVDLESCPARASGLRQFRQIAVPRWRKCTPPVDVGSVALGSTGDGAANRNMGAGARGLALFVMRHPCLEPAPSFPFANFFLPCLRIITAWSTIFSHMSGRPLLELSGALLLRPQWQVAGS